MGRAFIITRPSADSARFAAAVEAAGHELISAPLLEIVLDPGAAVPRRDYQAVAITSANGARAIAAHAARQELVRAVAVTVGPASTRAAREAGFGRVIQAAGDVRALIGEITASLDPAAGPILYASGAITRGDLEGELAEHGFEVDRVIFYEARRATSLPAAVADFLRAGKEATVALYSPRSAKIWCELAEAAGLGGQAARLVYACLSRNVADVMEERLQVPPRRLVIPPRPDEAALLAALDLPPGR